MTVHAVLLIPAEGDPLNLLAVGPCGARPPTAYRRGETRWTRGPLAAHHPDVQGILAEHPALVLAWDGKTLRYTFTWIRERAELREYAYAPLQGMLTAERTVETLRRVYPAGAVPSAERVRQKSLSELRDLTAHLGTLLLLDADGREISE